MKLPKKPKKEKKKPSRNKHQWRLSIRIELGGQLGYYIDVLACSTKNLMDNPFISARNSCNPIIQTQRQGVAECNLCRLITKGSEKFGSTYG